MSEKDYEFEDTSPLQEAAYSMHELFVTLRDAGFSRRDSLELIAKILTGSISEMISNDSSSEPDGEEE